MDSDLNRQNNDTLSDQSDIDNLIAQLSGGIDASVFDGMTNSDDSSDLFDEVGFDEPATETNDNSLAEYSAPQDEMLVESTDSYVTEQINFDEMPAFSSVDMIEEVSSDYQEPGMFEEAYADTSNNNDVINDDFIDYIPENVPVSDDQCNVITKGTIINGGMISDCSLNVMGTINGDIECNGKLSIFGNVVGNSTASDIYVNTRNLIGNINSANSVKVALGTIVVGNVNGKSAVIAGAIKGDLDIDGPVILDSTAIIKGNITAKSIQMNNGAIHEGNCSFAYADINIDQIFEN